MTNIVNIMSEGSKGSLEGKVALVTGAGRGIGKAIAIGFANAGAAVTCVSRTETEINETAKTITDNGGKASAIIADASDMSAVKNAVEETVKQFGGLDILVVNHGAILSTGPVAETDPEDWCNTVKTNLFGAYYCIWSAVPHLKARGTGKIIVIGSGQGHRGTAGQSAYSASKAGTWALVQSVAQELTPFNISVNELLPGHVVTKIYQDGMAKLKGKSDTAAQKPSDLRPTEWVKQPEDVVPLALFLACQPDVGPTAQSYSLMRRFN